MTLLHNVNVARASRFVFVACRIRVLVNIHLLKQCDGECEKAAELDQEFAENEVRVDLGLALYRQLLEHVVVILVEQEIVPIIQPLEAKILVDVSNQLVIERLPMIELGQEHEEAFQVLLTIHLNIHLRNELEELVTKLTEE